MIVELVIPGEPAVKERPRCTGRGAVSTPKQRAAEEDIARLLQANYIVPELHSGDVRVEVVFLTDSTTKDWDNMAKLVCDALNGVLWRDDRQVYDVHTLVIRDPGVPPFTRLQVFLEGETEVIAR